MYIYHAHISAPSAHMIHINLNMIFYTHVQYYQNNLHKVYGKTNKHATHTVTIAETQWVLILVGMKIL